MRTRFIVGPILIACVAAIFLVDHAVFRPRPPLMPLVLLLLALAGWQEIAAMAGIRVRRGATEQERRGGPPLFTIGAVAIAYFHVAAWLVGTRRDGESFEVLAIWGIVGTMLIAFGVVAFRKDHTQHYRAVLETIVGAVVLGLLLAFHTLVYVVPENGIALAFVYFLGIKGTDIAAYLVGSKLGRHRILPVSPKKTAEGCIGGLAWGALAFGGVGALWAEWPFSWPVGVAAGIILAVAAQLGDLSESLLKRTYDTKDSGLLLPEFGGVLDLVDSLFFTGCVFWYALRYTT